MTVAVASGRKGACFQVIIWFSLVFLAAARGYAQDSESPGSTDAVLRDSTTPTDPANVETSPGGENLPDASGSASALVATPQDMDGSIAPGAEPFGPKLNYQTDLFTGRFTYAVPIAVAPARQGAEPTLALAYNSSGGNGWCGVGWGLEVGFIQRDTRKGVPIKWSLPLPAPLKQYEDARGFTASFGGASSSLVLVNSSNPSCLEYRQEVETAFLKYNFYPSLNYWEIIDKSGNKFYFGEASTSRMENTSSGWTSGLASSTFRWALNRVLDVNGNQTTVAYLRDSGQLYLTNILYNANVNSPALSATHSVDFILTNRSDVNIAFNCGYRVETRKLLSEIQVKASGANVRKYFLGYTNSPSTLRSLLASVTQYGSDFSSALPPLTFCYQQKPFGFEAATDWTGLYSEGETGSGWNSIRGVDGNNDTHVMLCDIDGDALPDRVMRTSSSPYNIAWSVERNTGHDFIGGGYLWGTLDSQGQTGTSWNSLFSVNANGATVAALTDINGDFLPDRIMRSYSSPYTSFYVQTNTGFASAWSNHYSFPPASPWTGVANAETTDADWLSVGYKFRVEFMDINGDGLPDRISRKYNSPYDRFKVQLNTRDGFSPPVDWSPLSSQNQTESEWNAPSHTGDAGNTYVMLADINGDGLPDRVMRNLNPPYTKFIVQFNNGAGFEPEEDWGPVNTQNHDSSSDWGSPIGSDAQNVRATLNDINGDGLLDRIMRVATTPYSKWLVQLNTGTGFSSPVDWNGLDSRDPSSASWNNITYRTTDSDTVVDLVDINGDGLADRVMRRYDSPYDRFVVQLNKGPFPDLLGSIENNLGGKVQVSYVPSTTWNNRNADWTSDPLKEGTRGLLPFPVYTVSQVSLCDGMGQTNQTTYSYKGGFYEPLRREFRGFSQVEVTDPAGTKTRTYFHQSGGRDDTALGEYQDQNSVAKKGIPYRIDLIGSDGSIYKITLNKAEETQLNANGWYFPYLSQTISMSYEGLSSYRAVAKQLQYDTSTGNLLKDINLGEVTSVSFANHTFTDIGTDSVYTHTAYANLGEIKNKPSSIKITSDSAGNNRLREALFFYDSRGNLITNQVWLGTVGAFITTGSIKYDQYGNPTNSIDAAGITTASSYDSTYRQFPTIQVTATFTNQFWYDARSGGVVQSLNTRGIVSSNYYDVFYRPRESFISTNVNGAPTLWRSRIDYQLGGIQNGISLNQVRTRRFDAVDTANGLESYTYSDGLGRVCQTRAEAENGQYRVVDSLYDERGQPQFQTLPYFSSSAGFTILTGTNLGGLTEYDAVGRPYRMTPAVQVVFDSYGQVVSITATGGDTGSPVAAATTSFKDGSNPWASVVTDPENKTKKSFHDAYGRITQIVEVVGSTNYYTSYRYDLLGNLTNVTDHANNVIRIAYDSVGRKTSIVDPDMGTWSYIYDNAGRLIQQTDARANVIKFFYSDPLGRMTRKEVFGSTGAFAYASTNYYDSNFGDASCSVFKGQLYMTTDREGWQKFSYDVRGRVLQTSRFIADGAKTYVTQSTFDDADRPKELTYPSAVTAKVRYDYDSAGNLTNVISTAGTGINAERFYRPLGFNSLGQPIGLAYGNGLSTTNEYFGNSKRLKRLRTTAPGGGWHQDLSYSFDKVSNLKSITDGVFTSGLPCASITNVIYDDLHRLTSLYSVGSSATRAFGYNAIGNVLTNGEAVGGSGYVYGTRPHAVTSAFGRSYNYDACGNMITRGIAGGAQTLEYDEENRLSAVYGSGYSVGMGYNSGGERLWRYSAGTGLSVWVGGIYEERAGKQLCHVFAGGRRIATFEPEAGFYAALGTPDAWASLYQHIDRAAAWPLQGGRAPWTILLITFCGLLGVCAAARRHSSVKGSSIRLRPAALWQQAVTFVSIAALTLAIADTRVEAQVYTPVFYYYHPDQVGSTTILTDRSGYRVDHYENTAFGREQYNEGTQALSMSNRFTGQILDEETGLYYYGARYYDPELGRFIQADTSVPSATNPQMLNRYTYCGNNPLKYVDPSGHSAVGGFFKAMYQSHIDTFSDKHTWINVGIGFALGGAIGAVAALGASLMIRDTSVITTYITGNQNAGKIASLVVAIGVAAYGVSSGVGMLGTNNVAAWTTIASSSLSIGSSSAGYVGKQELADYLSYASLASSAGGRIAGAYRAPEPDLQLGNSSADLSVAMADYPQAGVYMVNTHAELSPLLSVIGKIWALPNTVLGVAYGLLSIPFGATWTIAHNALEFHNVFGNVNEALTLGNSILYAGSDQATSTSHQAAYGDPRVQTAIHEMGHTWGYEQLGIFYLPFYFMTGEGITIQNPFEAGASVFGRTH